MMQGCTFLPLPRCKETKGKKKQETKDTAVGKAHTSPSNPSLPLQLLELVGTQAQAKAVLRLFLFKSQISKEKCFNPLHLIEGQGWKSAGKHDLSYLSLFLTARALPSGWKQSLEAPAQSICLSGSLDCENISLWMLFKVHPILYKSKLFFLLSLWSHPNSFLDSASLFSSLI